MAGEGVQAQPEVIKKLKVVARGDGPDNLRFRVQIRVGDGFGEETRQRPGCHQPQQQAGQQGAASAIGIDDGPEDQLACTHGQEEERQGQLHAGEAALILAGNLREAR